MTWSDNFERADGTLGSNWVQAKAPDWGGDLAPFTIEDGAAVGAITRPWTNGGARKTSSMYWHEAQGADQSIEVEVEQFWGNNGYIQLFTNANATDSACNFCEISANDGPGTVDIFLYHMDADGDYETASSVLSPPLNTSLPIRFRLESDANGAQRCYVNNVLMHSRMDPAHKVGPYVGMGMEYHSRYVTYPVWLDDFDRADGPVGTNWTTGLTNSNETAQLFTIASGNAVGPSRTSTPPYPAATMTWTPPKIADNQFVEVVFENWYNTALSSAYFALQIYNLGGAGGVSGHLEARRACEFQQYVSSGHARVTVVNSTYLPDGTTGDQDIFVLDPYTGPTTPRRLVLESYANGRQIAILGDGEQSDGVVVSDYMPDDDFVPTQYRQGIWMAWRTQSGRTSPRIQAINVGSLYTSQRVIQAADKLAPPKPPMRVHGIVCSYLGDGEYDIGKTASWLNIHVNTLFFYDLNYGEAARKYAVDYAKTFPDAQFAYHPASVKGFYEDAPLFRQMAFKAALDAWRYDDDDWVVFIDASESLSTPTPHEELQSDTEWPLLLDGLLTEARVATGNVLKLPFHVFLQQGAITERPMSADVSLANDLLEQIPLVQAQIAAETDPVEKAKLEATLTELLMLQEANESVIYWTCDPHYLSGANALDRMFKVSYAKTLTASTAWRRLDTFAQATGDAAVHTSIASYSYARYGDTAGPPPWTEAEDGGWANRKLIQQVRTVGLPDTNYATSDPAGVAHPAGTQSPAYCFLYSTYDTGQVSGPGSGDGTGFNQYVGLWRQNPRDGVWYVNYHLGPVPTDPLTGDASVDQYEWDNQPVATTGPPGTGRP